jgi:lipopolysaccharide biosynthesis glycosyltransferase
MKKALVTQAFGDKWHKVLELTKPRMESYCQRHKIDLISFEKPLVEPVQYSKLAIGNIIATKGYEQVTFLDCDVLVAEDCEDIGEMLEPDCTFMAFDEGSYLDRKPGLKGLADAFGFVPGFQPSFYFNTGVFVITPKAVGALCQPPIGLFPNHFAEQTWMNLQLHLWSTATCSIDPAYNCMTSVEEHFGLDRYADAKIIHYAGQSADLNKLAETIKADDAKLKELGR